MSAGSSPTGRDSGPLGRAWKEVTTPALLIDVDALNRNISAMASRFAEMSAQLRPHVKGHKSVEIARLQVQAGAAGVTAATAWEALVMARAGIGDVLIANEVVGLAKVAAVAAAARQSRITVAVDAVEQIVQLAAAAEAAGIEIGVVVEIDIGMRRCGVSSLVEALSLVDQIKARSGVVFRGIEGYEGHCMHVPDPDERAQRVSEALGLLVDVADGIRHEGHSCEIVSAGGTGTYALTGTFPGVTEVQAGSYVFMDLFHRALTSDFEVSLTVSSTVISSAPGRIVLDAGRKSVAIDLGLPELKGTGRCARSLSEEHAIFDLDQSEVSAQVGDVLELVPGYAPSTVNIYDVYHVLKDGIVVDVWPVVPRGPAEARGLQVGN